MNPQFKLIHTRISSTIIRSYKEPAKQWTMLEYKTPSHKEQADADFKRIITELNTYGINAGNAEFERIHASQKGDANE